MTLVNDHLVLEREVFEALHLSSNALDSAARETTTREAALVMLSRCAQEIQSISQLQTEAGRLAASTLDLDLFVVSELEQGAKQMGLRIGRLGDSEGILEEAACGTLAEDSAAGFAISAGRPVVIADLDEEPRFNDGRLAGHGARGGIVCPVGYGNQQYGAIGIFDTERRSFSKEDVLFVQSIALLLGPTIAHYRAEKTLAEQSKFLDSTIDSLESIVLLLTSEGEILRFNKACQALGGFALEELRHRTFSGAFLLPEEVGLLHDAFGRLRNGEPNPKCETFLLTKSGERRRISWSFSKLPFKSEEGLSVIVSGIDITDQHNALSKLDDLETTLRNHQEANSSEARRRKTSGRDADQERGVERRAHQRRAYPYIQSIGPVYDGQLPELSDFQEVRCRDISPRGFSYLTPEAPDYVELVVTFGTPPSQLFLQARIVHVSPVVRDGRELLLVGCEYLQKIELT